jgi:DNA-binding winged helix-turn-helix (wHTH) protein
MASKPEETGENIRFGEDFELDLRAYQLRRGGRVLKLEPTPMELLLFLVEHKGEMITRDQIVEKIWGKGVFLDTDNSINGAIRKIRQVLRDNPDEPRFVQTIPGKGYRFIASVTEPGAKEKAQEREGDWAEAAKTAEAGTGAGPGKYWMPVVAATAAVAVVVLAGYFYFHRAPKLTDKDTIVLADFANSTGDPVFDDTLRQGLAVQLEQSPFLSLISDERIQRTLKLMAKPADARLTPEVSREICERTASAAVLDGSIASLGSQYVLTLRAKDCRSGDVLDEEQVQAARKEDVLNALSQISSRFRTRVGESLTMVEKHDTPLADATTPSLEALKSYSTGLKVLFSTGSDAALPLFQRAIEIDPKFAAAQAFVGRMYGDLGETALSTESTNEAYQLRDRASDPEKFFITVSYDMQVTGNMEKAEQTCELWIQTYPREIMPHSFLSGIILPVLGKYERAVEEGKKTVQLDPDFAIGYGVLAYSYAYLDRIGDAENDLRKASERKLEIPDFLIQRYDIAFLKGDAAGMQREVALAQGKTKVQDWVSNHEAFALAYRGRLREASDMSRTATELAQQTGQRERAATYEAGEALREAFFGEAAAARRDAKAALEMSNARDVEYGAAMALALAEDTAGSEELSRDLGKRFPEDTSVRFSYLPTLRAMAALNHKQPQKAIDLLQAAIPYELSAPESSFFGFFGALYPTYVRGEGFLAAHRGQEAAAEFQRILDHRGTVISDPVGALAHLQLGRAYAMSGDIASARGAYQDFLTLWKDADPDIPILKQAKGEYARLL